MPFFFSYYIRHIYHYYCITKCPSSEPLTIKCPTTININIFSTFMLLQDLFLKGAQLYMDTKYEDSIEVMEMSLKEYFLAAEECRLLCEGPMLEKTNEELYVAVTSMSFYQLKLFLIYLISILVIKKLLKRRSNGMSICQIYVINSLLFDHQHKFDLYYLRCFRDLCLKIYTQSLLIYTTNNQIYVVPNSMNINNCIFFQYSKMYLALIFHLKKLIVV